MFFWLIVVMLPGALAALFTQLTFSKYSKERSASGMTGAEAAARLLSSQGVHDVTIEPVQGFLSDHYDPSSRTLRLSPGVYQSDSLSAIGVACHEAGHALQHAAGYGPLALRTMLVPAASIGHYGSYIVLIIGASMMQMALIKLGLMLFAATVVFTLVTLPVEWDASARAKQLMTTAGIVTSDERDKAATVLNAAFMTYVAAAFTSVMTLLYYLMRFGLLGGRRSN